jgi:molecular chaperone IbpA
MVNAYTLDPSRIATYSVGFDRMFDSLMGANRVSSTAMSNYPPYNIVKHSDDMYTIEIAVAGFSKDEIEIESKENTLTVKSIDIETSEVEKKPEYLHKGISARSFNKTFTVSDDVIVKGADLKDGLLYIQLERIIPEEKKARSIKIK